MLNKVSCGVDRDHTTMSSPQQTTTARITEPAAGQPPPTIENVTNSNNISNSSTQVEKNDSVVDDNKFINDDSKISEEKGVEESLKNDINDKVDVDEINKNVATSHETAASKDVAQEASAIMTSPQHAKPSGQV